MTEALGRDERAPALAPVVVPVVLVQEEGSQRAFQVRQSPVSYGHEGRGRRRPEREKTVAAEALLHQELVSQFVGVQAQSRLGAPNSEHFDLQRVGVAALERRTEQDREPLHAVVVRARPHGDDRSPDLQTLAPRPPRWAKGELSAPLDHAHGFGVYGDPPRHGLRASENAPADHASGRHARAAGETYRGRVVEERHDLFCQRGWQVELAESLLRERAAGPCEQKNEESVP